MPRSLDPRAATLARIAQSIGVTALALAVAGALYAGNLAVLVGAATGALVAALGWAIARRIFRPIDGDRQALRAREAELAKVVETMVEGVALLDADGRITMVNAAAERILGASRAEILGQHYDDVPWRRVSPEGVTLAGSTHPFALLRAGSERVEGVEMEIVTAQGRRTSIHVNAAVIRGERGELAGIVSTMSDQSERKLAEARTRRAQELLERALEASKVALFEVDVATGIVNLSESWSVMRGGPPEATETSLPALLDLTHPEDKAHLWAVAMATLRGESPGYEAEHRVSRLAGGWIWIISRARVVERDSAGHAVRVAGSNVDVTERKHAEQRIHYLNTRDTLTDLSNRALFAERLAEAIEGARRQSRPLALVELGIDRFTAINHTLGHDVGDQVLKTVAGRISATVGVEDVVGRPGGDEFLVLLARVSSPDEAARAAEAMRSAVAAPIPAGGRQVVVTMSAGIAMFPDDADSAGALLRNGGTALTVAKSEGGDRARFFAAHMNTAAAARFETEEQLRLGLERGEFVLHYQPQVDLATGVTVGWEALVRWNHPQRGLLPPGKFLPVADASGLIVPLGEHVMYAACRQAQAWKRAGMSAPRVAINVSARQFRSGGFIEAVRGALASTGLDPRLLELEIVENVLIGHEPALDNAFEQLGRMGVELAIDDFGTGYSSLSYLQRLPIDIVKIDQSFVRDVPAGHGARAIVHAVIAMAHGLGLRVVAEGIERPSQLEFLRQAGCDRGQGHLLGRPAAAEHWSHAPYGGFPLERPESPSASG